MKGMVLLPFLTTEQRKWLETSELSYRRHARIYFQVLSYSPKELRVKVWQMENPLNKYLSSKELVERAKGLFAEILPPETKLHVRPIVYKKDDLEKFSVQDVSSKMEELGLKAKDLVKLLDIDKSSLSLILKGERELTKPSKAMLYYLSKYLETNPAYRP
jgi:antitoxin component HigA of HigAB toxin-antitoxin module